MSSCKNKSVLNFSFFWFLFWMPWCPEPHRISHTARLVLGEPGDQIPSIQFARLKDLQSLSRCPRHLDLYVHWNVKLDIWGLNKLGVFLVIPCKISYKFNWLQHIGWANLDDMMFFWGYKSLNQATLEYLMSQSDSSNSISMDIFAEYSGPQLVVIAI